MKLVDIEDFYRDDKDLKKEHVKQLMEWVDKQPHLPKFTEVQIIRFLWSCYYNNEFAKVTIENNATMRTYFPEVFQERNVKSIERSLDTVCMGILPKQTPEGYHITLFKLLDADPAKFDCREAFKKMDMLISIWSAIITKSPGAVLVIDSSGSSMGHFVRLDFSIMKKYIVFLQEALPVRLKAIHIINANAIVDKVILLLRPIINNEMFNLIKVHKKLDSLYKYVPQEHMPYEYGGKAGTSKELHEIEKKRLIDYAEYLRAEEKLVVDERKRLGKMKSENDVFGIEGTFKKLDID